MNTQDLISTKKNTRNMLRNILKFRTSEERSLCNRTLSHHLNNFLDSLVLKKGEKLSLGGFSPIQNEEPEWFLRVKGDLINVSFPRIDERSHHMHFYSCLYKDLVDEGPVKIPLEGASRVVPKILLIPGLAFDKSGGRLGRGGGYFDRYLANYTGLRVGLCFECQILPEPVPHTVHDQQVHFLITEKNLLDTTREEFL